jgi:hypothetical protein
MNYLIHAGSLVTLFFLLNPINVLLTLNLKLNCIHNIIYLDFKNFYKFTTQT